MHDEDTPDHPASDAARSRGTITLVRIDPAGADREELIAFMTGEVFPFHVGTRPTREQVEDGIADGRYRDDDNDSFWIDHVEHGRIGFFRLEEISDGAPLFDLRLASPWRGRGLAKEVVKTAADHVFTTMPEVDRFEGQTREDNRAMRRVFEACGWVQEAYYREGWPVEGAEPLGSVAYSILRRDWETGEVTPLRWS
ncbi:MULTISPECIES: GNAT family N-acetyltransferase [Microbacterium]|uniref:GNAT family N-acetyltransferase n=1 Tax=Microbacterium TaxID=33882 RepID=UPI000FEE31D0|nr:MULTISPECIES: GNAT family N-acetyltransferase [Microbacterium]RKE63812.1 RimJ/RimL family protein N-acetyltransferase [Microbacterium sp. AG238]WJM16557.1 GNAT family N-acetyltransferase [Microbacterium arborescens]